MPQPRSTGWQATSRHGVVAAGGAAAVDAGLSILEADGNAADAAVATIFALNVTDHIACSIGGEVPVLIYAAEEGRVRALSGQGRAPWSQEAIDWYMQNGIPAAPDIKMAPVPSVVDLCITLLQRYGTMTLAQVTAPVLSLLDEAQEDWHPRLAHTLRRMVEEESLTTGSRQVRLQAACDRFYGRHATRNDIAEELEAYYIEKGGFLRRQDLARHITTIEEPVTADYRGYTVCKCGPWTQGPSLCQALRLLEGFDLTAMGHLSADSIHHAVEALKLAFADRDAYYGDPQFTGVPMSSLLSDRYTEVRRTLIDAQLASDTARPGDPYRLQALAEADETPPAPGGTTTCVITDRWGNVVSATPSANIPRDHDGGGATGVTYGNRLRSLNTTPGHPNCIQPGKRPRITLTPTLVLKQGRPAMAVSVAGGDLQDQIALNLLMNAIDYCMDPAEAVTTPRFSTDHHEDSFDPNPQRSDTFKGVRSLTVNDDVDEQVQQQLADRGHQVTTKSGAIGTPVMLAIHDDGSASAAGDPAARRHAAGVDA
ncbi:MAG: gamma-glutamyltransferase [Candidatus Latescibacterota bacterium]|nr:gamma-glutamyltransferase [Candidatus Latescibacterota bacterium]